MVCQLGIDVLHRWNRFADWVNRADLSEMAQYEQAAQQLDIENFTSYFLLNIWMQNVDWPHNNRIVARPRAGRLTGAGDLSSGMPRRHS